MAFKLSADRVYNLYIHQPRWRLYVFLRFITIVFSIVAIVSFAIVVNESRINPSRWTTLGLNSKYFEWIFFVPVGGSRGFSQTKIELLMEERVGFLVNYMGFRNNSYNAHQHHANYTGD